MGRVILVQERDENSSISDRRQQYERDLYSGQCVEYKRPTPDDYLNVLNAKKSKDRIEAYPKLPKSLTPKGYCQFQILMKLQQEAYTLHADRLRREGIMWVDEEFPPDKRTLGTFEKYRVEWKRVKDINPNAVFIEEGASRFDIVQGYLGDCWLLAVLSTISEHKDIFNFIVPANQDFNSPDYVGVIRMRFWRFGQWKEVLVDDYLPVMEGTNQLIFMRSASSNEMWSAFAEKAYAKLYGGYGNLAGGSQAEAMEDVTGGICETISMKPGERPSDLLSQMQTFSKRCCLMGVSLATDVSEQILSNGLVGGHAYSVTGLEAVTYRQEKVWLVRCRNPWGNNSEWRGAWSDNSPEWHEVNASEKTRLQLKFAGDGEFWMSYDDFVTNFHTLEVCHLGHDSLTSEITVRGKSRFDELFFSGKWEKNVSAGGCFNNRATFHMNPQFKITVTDPDPDDADNLTTVIIGLMQEYNNRNRVSNDITIGFVIYELKEEHNEILDRNFFLKNRFKERSAFENSREIVQRFRLPSGKYVIIPSTFDVGEESKFILRVFAEVPVKGIELDDQVLSSDIAPDIQEAVNTERMLFTEDDEVIHNFIKMAEGKQGSITAKQLMNLLNNSSMKAVVGFHGFTLETCRSILASMDTNLTGLLEIKEVWGLWNRMRGWKHIFMRNDEDQQGTFSSNEFRNAIKDAGFSVSNRLFDTLVHRYTDPDYNAITFEDFMLCLVRLQNVFDVTNVHPSNLEGARLFTKEDYMRLATYI